MGDNRIKQRAEGLVPWDQQPLRNHGYGERVFHNFPGNRMAMVFPPGMKGPIRGIEARQKKVLPGYGEKENLSGVVFAKMTVTKKKK